MCQAELGFYSVVERMIAPKESTSSSLKLGNMLPNVARGTLQV